MFYLFDLGLDLEGPGIGLDDFLGLFKPSWHLLRMIRPWPWNIGTDYLIGQNIEHEELSMVIVIHLQKDNFKIKFSILVT